MAGPSPYQPIQYPDQQLIVYAGEITIGPAHKFQVDSNSPTQFASGYNKGGTSFWVSAAVARDASGSGFVLANNAAAATASIGLATLGAPGGKPEVVQLYGLLTMDDWTPTTGTKNLVALGNYYLDVVSGKLTTVQPVGPAIAQIVGIAISPATLQIIPCWCGTSGTSPTADSQFHDFLVMGG
jgi:hypothetical protein